MAGGWGVHGWAGGVRGWGVCVAGGHAWLDSSMPPIWLASGWYASYWNADLFVDMFLCVTFGLIRIFASIIASGGSKGWGARDAPFLVQILPFPCSFRQNNGLTHPRLENPGFSGHGHFHTYIKCH